MKEIADARYVAVGPQRIPRAVGEGKVILKGTRKEADDAQLGLLVLAEFRAWVKEYDVSNAEAIYQVDSVNEALPELVEGLLALVGEGNGEG